MKTQLQKPAAGKARYSAEYKREALEHWRNSGRSAAGVSACSAAPGSADPARAPRRLVPLKL